MKSLILVDVMNLAWRSHHVFSNLSHEGKASGVLFGFLRAVLGLKQISPHILFCWDSGSHNVQIDYVANNQLHKQTVLRNWRYDILPTYKSNRNAKNDVDVNAVYSQMERLLEVLCWMGYGSVSINRCEADDVIGLICGRPDHGPIHIFSTDEDFYQLLDKDVCVMKPKKDKGEFRYVTMNDVWNEYSILPADWPIYLGLGGDTSDSIKPAKGMGPKTALKLTQALIDPTLPWAVQNIHIKQQYSHLEAIWEVIQRCHNCARIPTQITDRRLRDIGHSEQINSYLGLSIDLARSTSGQAVHTAQIQRQLLSFFAEYDLRDFIQRKQEFFRF